MAKKKSHPRSSQPFDKFVGGRIRMARIAAKMSQTELGEKLGVTFQQIQKYEKGKNRVAGGRLSDVAKALGVTVSWLMDEPTSHDIAVVDAVLTKMLSTTDGTKLATNFLAASPAKRRTLVDLSRQLAA